MNKAEKIAVEKYPHGTFDGELGDSLRAACAVGYYKAEKDLADAFQSEYAKELAREDALTWEDMKLIIAAEGSIYDENHGNSHEVFEQYPTEEAFYEEVLRRFREMKNK